MKHHEHWDFFLESGPLAPELPSDRRHHDKSKDSARAVSQMRHGYLAVEPGCQPETKATELY